MPGKKQTRGECAFCGKSYTRGGLRKHLNACAERKEAIQKAEASKRKIQPLFHLVVYDAFEKTDYWLHLEVNGTAKLADIDYYLRAIWLECCGHMSAFNAGTNPYNSPELDMALSVDRVCRSLDRMVHVYDFGTSSETLVDIAGARKGRPMTGNPVFLMARNHPPEYPCMECKAPATYFCPECAYEYGETGLLCETHGESHPHDDYGGVIRLFNSPRSGMCGYDGPAEPPY